MAELPDQFVEYMVMKNINPPPPKSWSYDYENIEEGSSPLVDAASSSNDDDPSTQYNNFM